MAPTRLLSFKLLAAALCAATMFVVLPAAAAASPGHFRGVVTASTPAGRAFAAKLHPVKVRRGTKNLTYHNGPVMHTDANYAIFWEPNSAYTTSSSYKALIGQYLANVQAANGATGPTGNDYSVARQYTDGTGAATDNPSYAGSITDTDAYPTPSGCTAGGGEPCITDSQLQTELAKFIADHLSLPRPSLSTMYFVFFPGNVATCFDSTGTQCSTNTYCAYHSSFGGVSNSTLYANMSDADWSGCESGQYPNGNVSADSTINIVSHENIEAITDPLGTAWYDSSGNEIGDKCAWNFGPALGGAPGSEYNEQINSTGYYYLQQEWSNASSGCVQRY